jgi:2-oxoglutarate ferredoxin oxidoreductase subunit beta
MDFIPPRAEITVDSHPPGEVREVRQHDGSMLRLRKLPDSHDTGDRVAAMNYLHECQARGEIVTGLLYVDPEAPDLHAHFDTVAVPLNTLGERELCPGTATLAKVNASLR